MQIRVSRDDIYIPKCWGNRKLKEDEQIKVHFSYMTSEQEEKYTKLRPKYTGEKQQDVEMIIESHANEIWYACVKRVENLINEKTQKEMTSAEVRAAPGMYELITEVVAHIKVGIEGLDAKN